MLAVMLYKISTVAQAVRAQRKGGKMQIKFSHTYPKLHGQTSATLRGVYIVKRADLTDKFIEYDTAFDGGHYPLPPAEYMVLVFLGNEFIPFTTVRRWTGEKYLYYSRSIGKRFEIEVAQ